MTRKGLYRRLFGYGLELKNDYKKYYESRFTGL